MIMAFNWTDDELPKYLSQFNGLYIKYLEQCHVISIFNMGEKYGILSHSGYPKKLTYPFGYDADSRNEAMNFQKGTLASIIPEIESEKMELITQVQDKKLNMYNYDIDYMINKFVHLTAGTTFENPIGAKSSNSPVVWGQTTNTNERTNIKAQIKGGESFKGGEGFRSWIERDVQNEKNKIHMYVNDETENIISYNIFGHAPQYFNPTLYRKTTGNTLHVNLDISKIEANGFNSNSSNNYSFAFFYIDGLSVDTVIGRIKFPEGDKIFPHAKDTLVNKIKEINAIPKPLGTPEAAEADAALAVTVAKLNSEKAAIMKDIYKSNAYMDATAYAKRETVHYYKMEINDNAVDISLESNILGTNIKVASYPPLDFTKYLYTV